MNRLAQLFTDTLSALCNAGAKFVVVGGFATVMQGAGRSTSDLDLVIDLSESNIRTILGILKSLGFQCRLPIDPAEFAQAENREKWVREKNLQVLSFYQARFPAFAVDLFASPPITHAELSSRAVPRQFGKWTVPIAAVDDLITMKQISGRPLDLEDIAALRAVRHRQTNES